MRIEDAVGNLRYYVTQVQLDLLLEKNAALEKIGLCTYREKPQVAPSVSADTMGALTAEDMRALTRENGPLDRITRERLIGHGVLGRRFCAVC